MGQKEPIRRIWKSLHEARILGCLAFLWHVRFCRITFVWPKSRGSQAILWNRRLKSQQNSDIITKFFGTEFIPLKHQWISCCIIQNVVVFWLTYFAIFKSKTSVSDNQILSPNFAHHGQNRTFSTCIFSAQKTPKYTALADWARTNPFLRNVKWTFSVVR